MLVTTEESETSGAKQKVLGVRWNFVSDQFLLHLREIAILQPNNKMLKCHGKLLWSNGIPVTHHYRVQDILSRTLQGKDWLGQTSRSRVEERVVEAGHWIAMYKFIHSFKMLFPRSNKEDCFSRTSWIWRCIQQGLCSSDIPTCHNNHGKLCQILSLAIQSCSSETRDNPAINLLARLLRRDRKSVV